MRLRIHELMNFHNYNGLHGQGCFTFCVPEYTKSFCKTVKLFELTIFISYARKVTLQAVIDRPDYYG